MAKKVELDERKIVEVLKHIEIMLQSLHRVGSFYADDLVACDRETIKIIDDFEYCKRLARVRYILSVAAKKAFEASEWEAIEDKLCNVRDWKPPKSGRVTRKSKITKQPSEGD